MPKGTDFIKRWLWRLLTAIALIAWIGLLTSAFSDRISPHTARYVPFLGLFFPLIFGVNVLLMMVFLVCRKWKQWLAAIAVMAVCWTAICAYFPLHAKTKELPENCVKLLTYNVFYFSMDGLEMPAREHPIIQFIKEQQADIVCLQEFRSGKQMTEDAICQALSEFPYHAISPPELAIFSKYPIRSSRKLSKDYHSFLVTLDVHGKELTLINNHLASNQITYDERDEYLSFTKDMNSENFKSFTHLMFRRLTPAYQRRTTQVDQIDAEIKKITTPYVIVCGDFNDTPISYTRHTLMQNDLIDSFAESGNGIGISFNKNRFLFRIDYILHSKNIKSYNATVGKIKSSDHYPVWTYLQLTD